MPVLFLLLFGLSACANNDENLVEQPAIVLSPQSGGALTEVVVTGEAFPAGTAVMVRLGPPDIGATPFSYASGVVDGDGRFTLSFTIPADWPDGIPITETALTVIVLNDDGNVRATAPFTYLPDVVAEPTAMIVDGIITPDSIQIANEEAIVRAVTDYLTDAGESIQAAIAVEQVEGEFARVSVVPLTVDSTGNLTGYLKLVGRVWEVLILGQDFDSDQLLELGIPASILPEVMLTPEG